ncbi:MAG: Hpt domain-containing protein [Gammaproteobacteria bacterium]|nr:Hpt domain-containing protein [Gammaproteobacteria bacterium]MBU1724288.1 Hpt domain-containing protein [Gammaproteobacteria bacterium]MBU2006284.1 Hpt domain-containing protein [Gammaproteobacteria bacterium]
MKTLLETLGPEATLRFLTVALPQFEQRSEELLTNLRTGNWQEAARCAHRLKGTIHLYDSPELQEQLQQLTANDTDTYINDHFLPEIEEKLTKTKDKIRSFISNS